MKYKDYIPQDLAVRLQKKGMPIYKEQEECGINVEGADEQGFRWLFNVTYADVFDWLMSKGFKITTEHWDDEINTAIDTLLSEQDFLRKYCDECGSQRCLGVVSEFAEGCPHYKKHILVEEVPFGESEEYRAKIKKMYCDYYRSLKGALATLLTQIDKENRLITRSQIHFYEFSLNHLMEEFPETISEIKWAKKLDYDFPPDDNDKIKEILATL